MSRFTMIALVLGCGLTLASSQLPGLRPELEPKSHKKFFGKDYPNDIHAVADEHYYFHHPYPAVQDTGDFDKDFVKDENSDGGAWAAHMEYDVLRQKVRAAEASKLKRKMEQEAAEMKAAYEKWQEALKKVKAAKAATDAAKKAAAAADNKVKSLEDQVDAAAAKVEKEMRDLEACKKALADAKKRLKDLLAEEKTKTVAEKKQAKAEEEAAKKKAKEEADKSKSKAELEYQKQMDEYKKKKDEYDQAVKAAKDVKKTREQQKKEIGDLMKKVKDDEGNYKKKIDKKKSDYAASAKSYDEISKKYLALQAKLNQAAARLKVYRRPPYVDNNGGVYNVPQSFAAPAHLSALAVAALAAVLAW